MLKRFYLALIILTAQLYSQEETYTFTYFNNYPPLSWRENHQTKGIFIDIVDEIVKNRMGLKVAHTSYPWKRAQLMVKNGKHDAYITIPTEERLTYTTINSEPVYRAEFTIFTNINNRKLNKIREVKTISDLGDLKLVHYSGSGWAKENLDIYDILWTRTLDKSLLLLSLNRVDVFIDPSVIIGYNIKRKKYTHSIIEIKTVLDSNSFMLCVGNHSNFLKYIDEFDSHLLEIKKDGTMERILAKYR